MNVQAISTSFTGRKNRINNKNNTTQHLNNDITGKNTLKEDKQIKKQDLLNKLKNIMKKISLFAIGFFALINAMKKGVKKDNNNVDTKQADNDSSKKIEEEEKTKDVKNNDDIKTIEDTKTEIPKEISIEENKKLVEEQTIQIKQEAKNILEKSDKIKTLIDDAKKEGQESLENILMAVEDARNILLENKKFSIKNPFHKNPNVILVQEYSGQKLQEYSPDGKLERIINFNPKTLKITKIEKQNPDGTKNSINISYNTNGEIKTISASLGEKINSNNDVIIGKRLNYSENILTSYEKGIHNSFQDKGSRKEEYIFQPDGTTICSFNSIHAITRSTDKDRYVFNNGILKEYIENYTESWIENQEYDKKFEFENNVLTNYTKGYSDIDEEEKIEELWDFKKDEQNPEIQRNIVVEPKKDIYPDEIETTINEIFNME